jgi:hypothetical protein
MDLAEAALEKTLRETMAFYSISDKSEIGEIDLAELQVRSR